MEKIIKGKAFVFGTNVDTDQIYPGRYLDQTSPEDVGKHAMEGADPNFRTEFTKGDIVVANTNFGCGSSREQAAVTLKYIGVGALVADSFGRIFYRNAVNMGIPLLICPGITDIVKKGDTLSIDMTTGKIVNETTGQTKTAQPLTGYVMNILENGGIKALIKKQYAQ